MNGAYTFSQRLQCGLQTSYSLLPRRLEKQTLAPKAFINGGVVATMPWSSTKHFLLHSDQLGVQGKTL